MRNCIRQPASKKVRSSGRVTRPGRGVVSKVADHRPAGFPAWNRIRLEDLQSVSASCAGCAWASLSISRSLLHRACVLHFSPPLADHGRPYALATTSTTSRLARSVEWTFTTKADPGLQFWRPRGAASQNRFFSPAPPPWQAKMGLSNTDPPGRKQGWRRSRKSLRARPAPLAC